MNSTNLILKLKLLISLFLPWSLKRILLSTVANYSIAKDARIGFSWVCVSELVLESGARIGNFNIIQKLDRLHLGAESSIGQGNYVTCFRDESSNSYKHLPLRDRSLYVGTSSAITMWHLIDCNESVRIGSFSTIAGYSSQLLTHSIDLHQNRQHAEKIEIGDYCFVGTRCIVMGGSRVPSYCVLGAGALLNKAFDKQYRLYAGLPAVEVKEYPKSFPYFNRTQGSVE